jgi:hypothetical protein
MITINERELIFLNEVNTSAAIMQPEVIFPFGMLKQFYEYWSEPNRSKTKMKFELEKTWDTKRRLKRWYDNQQKWNNGNEKLGTSAARLAALKNF